MDFGVIIGAADRNDVRDAVDGTGSHKLLGFDEGNLADVIEIEISGEMSEGFHLVDREIRTNIIAERVGEVDKIGK